MPSATGWMGPCPLTTDDEEDDDEHQVRPPREGAATNSRLLVRPRRPVVLERLGRVGYDYVAIDGQHGLLGYSGILAGLLAIDAGAGAGGTGTVGLVRVQIKVPP